MKTTCCSSPLLLALLVLPASGQLGPHFSDASEDYGVLFEHFDGAFAYQMGGGVAWLDMDVDGDEDLLVVSSDGRNALYENKGDGSFENIAQTAGLFLTDVSNAIGVTVADYNQDGLPDIYMTNAGPNYLFRNNGDKTFTDVAPELGLDSDRWSSVSAWADFDRDGDLDLYVGNYVDGLNFPCTRTRAARPTRSSWTSRPPWAWTTSASSARPCPASPTSRPRARPRGAAPCRSAPSTTTRTAIRT